MAVKLASQYSKKCKIGISACVVNYDTDTGNIKVVENLKLIREPGDFFIERKGKERWNVKTMIEKKSANGEKHTIEFYLEKGQSPSSAIACEFGFSEYDHESYLLLPGCAYNGNKFLSRKIPYSPKLYQNEDISKDGPIIISDVPRLDSEKEDSILRDRAGALSVPLMGLFMPSERRAVFIQFPAAGPLGDHGLEFRENIEEKKAYFRVQSPVVRESTRYRICDNDFKSTDVAAHFETGYLQVFEFYIFNFFAETLQEFYQHFFSLRHKFTEKLELSSTLPLSECYRTIVSKFNSDNWVEEHGYYSVGMRENFLQDWQIGWTGGMISTLPLLHSGDAETIDRVLRNFHWLFSNGISPSGLFWDSGEKGYLWYGGDVRKEHTKNWHLVRKSSDALYWILRQFESMLELNIHPETIWEKRLESVANTFQDIWNKEGQLGQFIDSITGEIIVGGSSSAGILPAALANASRYYDRPDLLKTASEIAAYLFTEYVSRGITCGGPGDALQSPDSESAFGLLESYVTLHEITGLDLWLSYAQHTANLCSSWIMNYNYVFPQGTTLGKLGVKTTGSVFANIQNKHGSPGICINSGNALLRLSRYTKDFRYALLLRDITMHIPQLLSHPDKPVPGMKEGWITERVSTTDWFEGIGEIMTGSTWAETSLMLSFTDIPGIYVFAEKDILISFDQIDAEFTDKNRKSITIKNKTGYQTRIKLFVEDDSSIQKEMKGNIMTEIRLLPLETQKIKI